MQYTYENRPVGQIYPYWGHVWFNPSELVYTGYRIYAEHPEEVYPTDADQYSGTTMMRARFRGPFESYKFNKNKADINRDLQLVNARLNQEHNRLVDIIYQIMGTVEYPNIIRYIDIKDAISSVNGNVLRRSEHTHKTSAIGTQRLIDQTLERFRYWTFNLK